RNFALLSAVSLGSGYMVLKSRTLAQKQKERAAGDYSVSVDRSGPWHHNASNRRWTHSCHHFARVWSEVQLLLEYPASSIMRFLEVLCDPNRLLSRCMRADADFHFPGGGV
ncbi:hypothetical protein BDV96DRAFT_484403, partial [Lophiotrema nucula]